MYHNHVSMIYDTDTPEMYHWYWYWYCTKIVSWYLILHTIFASRYVSWYMYHWYQHWSALLVTSRRILLLAVVLVSLSVRISLSSYFLFQPSLPLNHRFLPSSFPPQNFLFSTSTVLLHRPSSPGLSLFFLDEFSSFLSLAATTSHEFRTTGDFNIDTHTLDLVITYSDTSLAASLFSSLFSQSDHFPVFIKLSIEPTPLPPPTLHSFRRLHSIDTNSFLDDIKSSPRQHHNIFV